jgi:hypothetical protein
MVGQAISKDVLVAVKRCVNDAASWSDIEDLIGRDAVEFALARARDLIENGVIPDSAMGSTAVGGTTGFDESGNMTAEGEGQVAKVRGAGKGKVAPKITKPKKVNQ